MKTVFSHIVQKRLSQENENVATEALAFILDSSEPARAGLMKLLAGVAPGLPALRFQTQQTEGNARPDMWGFDGGTPRVFIENKFWAGLTENHPVEYLRRLARYASPAVLLTVVPASRLETVRRQLKRRLDAAGVPATPRDSSAHVPYALATDFGPGFPTLPILALTTWTSVLLAIEAELEDPQQRNDLVQLRSLCTAADDGAAVPFSSSELTNQRTPAFVLQLTSVVQRAVDVGVTEGVLSVDRLRPTSSWERVGRYVAFPEAMGVGAWFGTDFRRWWERGSTPLWLVFGASDFGRALEVRAILQPWAEQHGVEFSLQGGEFGVGIDVVPGEEQDHVVRSLVDRLKVVAAELAALPPKPNGGS